MQAYNENKEFWNFSIVLQLDASENLMKRPSITFYTFNTKCFKLP